MRHVELIDVSVAYEGEGRPAIHDINLPIEEGEFVLIHGPNGAGKTTLLETINGLLKPFKGRVIYKGSEVNGKAHALRRKMGYVVQDFQFDPLSPFTVEDLIMMGLNAKYGPLKYPSHRERKRVFDIMDMLGILDLAHRPVGKLSGGQQQKVLLGYSLVKDPELLLLDEPLSHLDRNARKHVIKLMEKLNKEGKTVIVVSHIYDEFSLDKIRLVKMDSGRIVGDQRGV